ncbi:MAG TPA: hypothetical protein PK719_04855 [Bacteroidales bacterium]|nr:hypothetical protein [Bacteroidales bacterium]
MNRFVCLVVLMLLLYGCNSSDKKSGRLPVAKVGNTILYYDQIPQIFQPGETETDSAATVQNYINRWARKELLLQKAEENLTPEYRDEIARQIEETRANLLIYQYQRQMMLEKMDTVISDTELEKYYSENQGSFMLTSNIVKGLFIKIPAETPNVLKIKSLARSSKQEDLQELEILCYQFADKFDDFNEEWITLDRISVELPEEINNQESFLRRTTFYETADSDYLYLLTIRDYRLRSTLAPIEYVKEDIKRMIWNIRRIEFIQSLENGIYNDALKNNIFMIYNNQK